MSTEIHAVPIETNPPPPYSSSAAYLELLKKNVRPGEHQEQVMEKMNDFLTENCIEETMRDLTKTIIGINRDFDSILSTVTLFDSKNYRKKHDDGQPNGDPIQKFEPSWKAIKKSFNDYIWESREVATSGAGHAEAFHNTLLPIINDPDIKVSDKKAELKYYRKLVDDTEEKAKKMASAFEGISTSIGTFSTLFKNASKEAGLNLDAGIAKLNKDIEELDATIKKYTEIAESALKWAIGGTVVEGIGAAMILTGFLAPVGFVALAGGALVGLWNVKEGYDGEEKVANAEKDKATKKAELAKLTADKAEYEEINKQITTSMQLAQTIGVRVLSISKVWAVIRTETQLISDALEKSEGAPTPVGMKRYMSPKVINQYALLEKVLLRYANLIDDSGPKPGK